MKKKNYTMRIAAGVMTAALLSTCAISSTFAKYTTAHTGTDSARVAKWNILFGGETTMNKTFEFDLFDTTYGDATSPSVKSSNDDKVIAPGTQGLFAVKITNNSEVTAKYIIEFSVTTTANIPLKFSKDGSDWKTSIADLNIAATDAVNLAMDGNDTYTVYWKWDYEDATDDDRDENDTNLGTAGTDTLTVSAKVTATQVN